MIGRSLSHYHITAALGAGGMGEVWRARDTKLDRDVAIKMLPAELTRDPERLARLEREARLLAALDHPNIASIYGIEDGEDGKFLVMQLAEGEDLTERLRRGPLPVPDGVAVATQIAEGLEAAHEKGIVHRDLKPGNVKVGADGHVRLLDFGLAKGVEEEAPADDLSSSPTMARAATHAGMVLGTAAYMSPEQARGRPVDRRTDIWAFGAVLFEMLTGRPLFTGGTSSEVLASVIKEEPALERLPAGTPGHVRRLLERCLTPDPRQRLRDIGEARIALTRPSESRSEEGAGTTRRWTGAAWALAGLVAGAAAVLALRGGGAESPAPLRKLDLVADGIVNEWYTAPVLSPDGTHIAYVAESGVWVRDLQRVEPRRVAELTDSSHVFWAPDGSALGYSSQKKLWRVGRDGGRPVEICDLPGAGGMTGATWSVDGTVAFASWRGGMYRVAAEGGVPELLFPNEPGREVDFHGPSWLPNGHLIYSVHHEDAAAPTSTRSRPSVSGQPGSEVGLQIFDGQERRPVKDARGFLDWPTYVPSGHLLVGREGSAPGIWAVPFDLGTQQATGEAFLVAPDGGGFSASADGSLLYMEGTGGPGAGELTWVDRAGQALSILTEPQPGLGEPSLSPDGRQVAFTASPGGTREVLVVGAAGGTPTRLTFTDFAEAAPLWMPGARDVVYSELEGLTSRIVSRPADGSGAPRTLKDESGIGLRAGFTAVTPDGRWLIHARDERGHVTALVAPLGADGAPGESRPLLQIEPQPNVLDARLSPDGTLLAWVSDDSGQPEVYLSRFPEGTGRWQVSSGGGRLPRWARASGELFYIGGSGVSGRAMMVVSASGDAGVTVGTPTELFRVAGPTGGAGGALINYEGGFDVAPDGRRLLLVRQASGAEVRRPRMILVQNWLEEFRDRE